MAELEEELSIDIDLDIEHAILTALTETIGKNIREQWFKNPDPLISQETILSNFLIYNMDKLEEECFCTQGADGKVYACGEWLNRPVRYKDQMIPTMDYIIMSLAKRGINTEKLVFRPDISGIEMRKRLWKETNPLNSSYEVPKSGKDSFGQKRVIPHPPPGAMGAGGPPPGMGFGPPPGAMGAGGPPPGMGFGPPPGAMGAGGPPPGMGFGPPPGVGSATLEEIDEVEELSPLEEAPEASLEEL